MEKKTEHAGLRARRKRRVKRTDLLYCTRRAVLKENFELLRCVGRGRQMEEKKRVPRRPVRETNGENRHIYSNKNKKGRKATERKEINCVYRERREEGSSFQTFHN